MIRVLRSETIEAKPFQVNKMIGDKKQNFKENLSQWKQLFISYLPDDLLPKDIKNYSLRLDFFMTTSMDLDNSLKYTIDALEEKYGFNDRDIFHIVAYKHIVKQQEAAEGIENRFRIKVSLTEKLIYDDDNQGHTLKKLDKHEHKMPDGDYRKFFDLATYGGNGKP
jgi:Holliday junction resolvase RusA-like endonuclease